MSAHPDHLRYTASHEYVRREGEAAVIGITRHAAEELGDVVYVELPAPGTQLAAGKSFGEIESVKAMSDLYMPIAGTVTAVNEALEQEPGLVNKDPYEAGWMIKVTPSDPASIEALLTREQYEAGL